MFRFKRKIKKDIEFVEWQGKSIKLNIFYESRLNSRVSVSSSGINIRVPLFLSKKEQIATKNKFIEWAKRQLLKNPNIIKSKFKEYRNGEVLHLYDESFIVRISYKETEVNAVKLKGNNIYINLSSKYSKLEQQKEISKAVCKVLRKKYQLKILNYLAQLNKKHQFGNLNTLRLKNNKSNWGSCSTKGNINISLRLLLAPKEVVEYVLIHELAHLKELNHSNKFWDIVKRACPKYKEQEKWLKENKNNCIL